MPINPVNRAKTIVVPLTTASSDQIVTVYQNTGLAVGSQLIPGHTVVSYNCFVKNLKAFSQITSLPEIALPNFDAADSDTTKLYKTLDVEWNKERKQLNLFVAVDSTWQQVGSISLLNPSGYPFRVYSLLDLFTDNLYFELGENGKIGVQIQEVGYGLLSGNDKVVIHGSYVEEIFVSYSESAGFVSVPVTIPPITVNVTGVNANPTTTPTTNPTTQEDDMSNWKIVSGNYTAVAKDKLLVDATQGSHRIAVPGSPTVGDVFKFLVVGDSSNVLIDFETALFKFNSTTYFSVPLHDFEYTLIYFGGIVGWTGTLEYPSIT